MRRTRRPHNAIAICERSGFQGKLKDMVVEPGTGLLVLKSENDGRYSRKNHPQNYPPRIKENIGVQNPRPGYAEGRDKYLVLDQGGGLADQDGNTIVLDE